MRDDAPEPATTDGAAAPWVVVTTVHPPGGALRALRARLDERWRVVVVGDARTPTQWDAEPVEFLSLERQRRAFGAFADAAPLHHYARKNFGYLHALRAGADLILDVDDDGLPQAHFPGTPRRIVNGRGVGGGDWANAYAWFTDRLIWPRGLPLDAIHRRGTLLSADAARSCPVQQFLVDDDPDVDAIYRLVFPGTGFRFAAGVPPVVLAPGTWCPFNSQNTLWFREAFALLYLPHGCPFRVTDIWRALVAQRALWLAGAALAFHPPTLRQERNPHDLQRDFLDEIPVWTRNRALAACLDRAAARLEGRPLAEAGEALWLALVDAGFLPQTERALIGHWFAAVRTASAGRDQRS